MNDRLVDLYARLMFRCAMIDVWLGMFDAMLIVICMLVCVCELDIEYAFNRVKI